MGFVGDLELRETNPRGRPRGPENRANEPTQFAARQPDRTNEATGTGVEREAPIGGVATLPGPGGWWCEAAK
jgi:hypothetical protein